MSNLSKPYDRIPFPFTETGTITASATATPKYSNRASERSEIKRILIACHPRVTATVNVTINGQKRTIVPEMKLSQWKRGRSGNFVWDFSDQPNKALFVRRDQDVEVVLSNSETFTVRYRAEFDKNQLVFYDKDEDSKPRGE